MKKKFKDTLFNLDLMLFFILTAIFLTILISPLIHKMDVNRYQLDLISGLDKASITKDYHHLANYLWLFHRAPLYLENFQMSTAGAIHFADVKKLVDGMQVLWMITAVIGGFGFVKRLKQKDIQFLKDTAILLIVVPLTIGFLAMINFNQMFVLFHQLFFSNDYWIFDMITDPVILILPEQFFMHCFFMIVLIVIVMAVALYSYYKREMQKQIKQLEETL